MKEFFLPSDFIFAKDVLSKLKSKDEIYWISRGDKRVLQLFQQVARRVPAYKDFLKLHSINPDLIKNINDFKFVPLTDKDNYLRKYPLPQLCWDGKFVEKSKIISTTSGSTGDPYYFPRDKSQDLQYALLAEMYLIDNFSIDKKTTLYINGFPMGVWIGGLFTYQAINIIANRSDYKLSIINPGIHKQEIINSLKNIGGYYDQIIIGSYGPFLKDMLDDATIQGVDLKKYNIKFIFSAEGFTEGFRDYVINKAGLNNIYTDTLNHYGTVDLGTMSHETPLAILIRRIAVNKPELFNMIFSQLNKCPTLTQYIPDLFYFEQLEGSLICSAYSGIPLVRYDLKDQGGILKKNDIYKFFSALNIDLEIEINNAGIDNTVWNLPFVYVHERSDFSVSFYAFQIYPQTIRKSLEKDTLSDWLTGKFTMEVLYNDKYNQCLVIHLEKKINVDIDKQREEIILDSIIDQLLVDNSEYRETYGKYKDRVKPKLFFYPYEDKNFFKPGIKQKWKK